MWKRMRSKKWSDEHYDHGRTQTAKVHGRRLENPSSQARRLKARSAQHVLMW